MHCIYRFRHLQCKHFFLGQTLCLKWMCNTNGKLYSHETQIKSQFGYWHPRAFVLVIPAVLVCIRLMHNASHRVTPPCIFSLHKWHGSLPCSPLVHQQVCVQPCESSPWGGDTHAAVTAVMFCFRCGISMLRVRLRKYHAHLVVKCRYLENTILNTLYNTTGWNICDVDTMYVQTICSEPSCLLLYSYVNVTQLKWHSRAIHSRALSGRVLQVAVKKHQ